MEQQADHQDYKVLMELWTRKGLMVRGQGEDAERIDSLVTEGIGAFSKADWHRLEEILRELGVLPTQAA